MLNVLVVDDDKSMRMLFRALLEQEKYIVFTAENGEDALRVMDEEHIDLVILDIMMPKMDGYKFTRTLRKVNNNLPILMVSAKQLPEDKQKGFIVGTDDYITKPIDNREMLLRVKALLRRAKIAADRKIVLGKVYRRFLTDMYAAASISDIKSGYKRAKQALTEIKINRPINPVRVGIIGEFYTAMDEFSNLEVERKLSELGIEVHRWMNLTNRMFKYAGENNLKVKIKDYVSYTMGATSTGNIWAAKKYAEQGFDGIVHIKSANCTPEIDIMSVLQNISEDYRIPVLYLTYDEQTSDVGLMTRLEAFYDMLSMRKKVFD